MAAVVAARAPVAHKSVTPVLKQADCDPTWEECDDAAYGEEEYGMECEEDDEECLAMMDEEEEEEAADSILMFAAPAAVLSGLSGFLMYDAGSTYSDKKDSLCTGSTCTYDDGLLGDLAGRKLLGMINLAYTPVALAGAFVPAAAMPVSFVSMAMVLQGVFTFISMGSYQDCTAAIVTADGYCNPATTADETTYAASVDPDQSKTTNVGYLAVFSNVVIAGLGFMMMGASAEDDEEWECEEGDEDCEMEEMWEECYDYYGEVVDCPEEDAYGAEEDSWY